MSMSDFLATYFGWEPSVAQLIWAVLLTVATRMFLAIRRRGWLENESFYWLAAPLAFLIVLAALTFAAKGAQPGQQWPPALTKAEIDNFSTALKPYYVGAVVINFVDSGQQDFVATLSQAIIAARWSEPSLKRDQFSIGVRILASQDVWKAAEQLQHLCERKIGTVRLEEIPASGPSNTIAMFIGWKPQ